MTAKKMDVYLDYFESIMIMKGYEEKDWTTQLLTKLTGDSFKVL